MLTNTLSRKWITFMAISCIDNFIRTARIAIKANVKRKIMSNHRCSLLIQYFQMNYKLELMTHIREKKWIKVEPEMESKRSSQHTPPHHTASFLSHLFYMRIKANETERKKWMFWPDNNRFNLHFVGQRRRRRLYAVPFCLSFNAIICFWAIWMTVVVDDDGSGSCSDEAHATGFSVKCLSF